jgi:hypothetical protein
MDILGDVRNNGPQARGDGGHRAQIVVAAIGAMAAVAAAFIGGQAAGDEKAQPRPTVTVTAVTKIPPAPYSGTESIEFTDPHRDRVDKVGRCIDVGGVGSVPAQQEIVLMVQREDDPQRYFEASVKHDADVNTWSGRVYLGDEAEPNGNFTIAELLVDQKLADYLGTTNRYSGHADNTWWASADPPPLSRTVATVQVERVSKIEGC